MHRRAGRPSLTGSDAHSPRISFRVHPDVRKPAERLAKESGKSLSGLAREAFEKTLPRSDRAVKQRRRETVKSAEPSVREVVAAIDALLAELSERRKRVAQQKSLGPASGRPGSRSILKPINALTLPPLPRVDVIEF